MSSMHGGPSTLERGVIRQHISYRTMEHVDKSAKRSFCIISRFSRRVVETVAKDKANAAVTTPLSPMKSPKKQAACNTRRASTIKMKFEKFLQGLPQADNRFSNADRPHTETVHLAPIGGHHASLYNVWIHWLQKEELDQFAKRGKADFRPQISLKTAQRTMKTFKLGYQAPMKDVCADTELYNLQILPMHRPNFSSVLRNVTTSPPPKPIHF